MRCCVSLSEKDDGRNGTHGRGRRKVNCHLQGSSQSHQVEEKALSSTTGLEEATVWEWPLSGPTGFIGWSAARKSFNAGRMQCRNRTVGKAFAKAFATVTVDL